MKHLAPKKTKLRKVATMLDEKTFRIISDTGKANIRKPGPQAAFVLTEWAKRETNAK